MVASECYPLVKTGGLADVVGALPLSLSAAGCRVRVMLPLYPAVAQTLSDAQVVAVHDDLFGGPARVLAAVTQDGLDVLTLDAPHLYDRPGNPYLGPDGRDWSDNHLRFAALSMAAARFVKEAPDGWNADIVHCHDWQAGLTPVYLRSVTQSPLPVVFTIHNIAFPGLFPATALNALELPPDLFTPAGFEYFGQISFLKAALVFADRLTTVSPTYALELQTPLFGMGFDGVLRARQADLVGILNGIDDAVWNPETDPLIASRYFKRTIENKAGNRVSIQTTMGLDRDPAALLACVVSRLTGQKGLDLLAETLPLFVEMGGQLALLGTGTPDLELLFAGAAERYRGRVGVRIAYDEALSHQIIAGADAIVVPSRFEPCGLTQLYGLRYGTIPIVARTGGLADSVIDANAAAIEAGVATGIVFHPIDAAALLHALGRAFELFREPSAWQGMIRAAMRQPVGWARSAARYKALYDSLSPEGQLAGREQEAMAIVTQSSAGAKA
jgi:starch synthase